MFSGKAQVCGIIGNPVNHSLSPFIHNLAGVTLGVELMYAPFPVMPGALGDALAGIRALGISGVNVTIPYKEEVIAHLDALDEHAAAIHAVNTIHREGDRLIGFNTDWLGFQQALTGLQPEAPVRRAVLLGAGGAARGVAYALAKSGVECIDVRARRPYQAEALAGSLRAAAPDVEWRTGGLAAGGLASADLIVNTTPIAMNGGGDSPLPEGVELHSGQIVIDIIYDPPLTPLLRKARAAGCRICNGFPMLVYQAWESLAIWTGMRPGEMLQPRHLGRLFPQLRGFLLEDEAIGALPGEDASPSSGMFSWNDIVQAVPQQRLVLVGFMGVGKTTIGGRLAGLLGWAFIDTDALVERRAGMSVAEIFTRLGEAAFRRLEVDAVFEALRTERSVVALGGGAFLQPTIRRVCERLGMTLWLQAGFERIQARCLGDQSRPLMREVARARQLFEIRQEFYMKADLTIPASGTVDETLEEIRYRLAARLTAHSREPAMAWAGGDW